MARFRRFGAPEALFFAHLMALIFGLIGLLIMLPHPDLWASDPNAVKVFNWSMKYAGSTHIIFGALCMLAVGWVVIGPKKTAIFAAVSYCFSLTSELLGTGTGWPFGNYSYTSFLGHKVLGHVPFTIPMSWFYMGLASYLIAISLVSRLNLNRRSWWEIGLAVWFLTVWDLALDPAMAHDSLRVKFWVWHQSGGYYGMPLKNFIGWSITGLIFIAIARWLWRGPATISGRPTLALAVYLANMAFAVALSASAGLWVPILLATVLGSLPALLSVRPWEAQTVARRPQLLANE